MVWVHKDHLIFVNTLNEWIIICYKYAPSSRHLSSLEFVCRNLSWLVLDGPAVNVAMNRTTQARNTELSFSLCCSSFRLSENCFLNLFFPLLLLPSPLPALTYSAILCFCLDLRKYVGKIGISSYIKYSYLIWHFARSNIFFFLPVKYRKAILNDLI